MRYNNILYILWLYDDLFVVVCNILKIAEIDCCQIKKKLCVPSTKAYTCVLCLPLDSPYKTGNTLAIEAIFLYRGCGQVV